MDFASDVTDKLHLPPGCNTDCSGSPLPCRCGPRTYEQRMRVQRNRISATYTGTAVTKVTGGSGDVSGNYFQLNDGGNPVGIVQLQDTTYKLVNTPVYISPPINPVSSKNSSNPTSTGATFNITVKSSSCCSC
jgi:hypothetical protein